MRLESQALDRVIQGYQRMVSEDDEEEILNEKEQPVLKSQDNETIVDGTNEETKHIEPLPVEEEDAVDPVPGSDIVSQQAVLVLQRFGKSIVRQNHHRRIQEKRNEAAHLIHRLMKRQRRKQTDVIEVETKSVEQPLDETRKLFEKIQRVLIRSLHNGCLSITDLFSSFSSVDAPTEMDRRSFRSALLRLGFHVTRVQVRTLWHYFHVALGKSSHVSQALSCLEFTALFKLTSNVVVSESIPLNDASLENCGQSEMSEQKSE